MKAIVCKTHGSPENLVMEDIPEPEITKDQVLIDVHCAGINFPDTLIIQNLYQHKPDLPFVPGTEVSGVAVEVGENVKHISVGQEVIGFNLVGAFAEKMASIGSMTFPKPKNLSMAQAAGFSMIYFTSLYALKNRGRLREGETVLVLGASGGVGMSCVEIAKIMGAKVIAAGGDDNKLEICNNFGADYIINYKTESLIDKVKEYTGGKGADVIYDPVGGDMFDKAIRVMNWDCRYLVIGFASGRIPDFPINRALIKNSSIVGVFWGASMEKEPKANRDNLQQLMQWVEEKKLNPYVHAEVPLAETAKGLQMLLDREVVGKVVVKVK